MALAKRAPRFATLVLLTGLSVLTLNMFLPALPSIAMDLGVGYSLASLSISGHLATTAALQLIIGPLSDKFGRRPILLLCMAMFAAASLGCALSTDIWAFLAFRILQGSVIAGYTLSLAVIQDTMTPNKSAGLIGYVSTVMAIAPMIGPILGGLLDEIAGWRFIFVSLGALGALALAACWIDLDETNSQSSRDVPAQFEAYPELFRSRQFWGYAICMTFCTGAFYAFLAGAPLVASAYFQMSPTELGFYMGSITAGFMVGSLLAGRFTERLALTTMMLAGRFVACLGLAAGLLLYSTQSFTPWMFFGATIFLGFGNGLTIPSCNAGALAAVPNLKGSAAGLSGALTVGGGALLMTLTGAMLTEANAAYVVLGMMLVCALTGLIAALYVRSMDTEAQDTG